MMQRESYFNVWEPMQRQVGYSQAVRVGDLVFVAGTASVGENFEPIHAGDFPAQLNVTYSRIGATLEHFGLDFRHVVREVMYVTDMGALVAAMELRKRFYRDGPFPAATGIEVRQLLYPELMIEVEVVAAFTLPQPGASR